MTATLARGMQRSIASTTSPWLCRGGYVPRTHPLSFSLDETTDVGVDTGAPVTHDHLIDPADIYRIAITKQ
ncbi:hypothetical protein [Rhodococcus jostii]|uniref:hypothetical protein n=1 Tax=Rhodococcus jostii TaxID=132919 RepID=UPI003637C550